MPGLFFLTRSGLFSTYSDAGRSSELHDNDQQGLALLRNAWKGDFMFGALEENRGTDPTCPSRSQSRAGILVPSARPWSERGMRPTLEPLVARLLVHLIFIHLTNSG